MQEWELESARRLLEGLVSEELLATYEKLLTQGGCLRAEAAEFVGSAELVEALTGKGMAHFRPHSPTDPPRLQPAPPNLALEGVLVELRTRLLHEEEQLLQGHRRLTEVQARVPAITTGGFPKHLVEVVTDRVEISRLSGSLINSARRDWMTLENLESEMPFTDEDFAEPPLPSFEGEVLCRSIYEAGVMEHSLARRLVQACVDAGEQARILPRVPMKMKLADDTVAMLPLTPTGTAGALVIRAPVILGSLREYFELLWERATPVGSKRQATTGTLTSAQTTVLHLMAEGLQDDAIARRAQLSTTTVRRHVHAIMGRLNAVTRFAAGVAAHRRGWLD